MPRCAAVLLGRRTPLGRAEPDVVAAHVTLALHRWSASPSRRPGALRSAWLLLAAGVASGSGAGRRSVRCASPACPTSPRASCAATARSAWCATRSTSATWWRAPRRLIVAAHGRCSSSPLPPASSPSSIRAEQEERRLHAQLGPAYADYCRTVKRLIPFVW